MGTKLSRINNSPTERLNRSLIWLFSRCNESKKLPLAEQLILAKVIHEAATHLTDADLRREIQSATTRAVSILSSPSRPNRNVCREVQRWFEETSHQESSVSTGSA
jgi:hypothetical protein